MKFAPLPLAEADGAILAHTLRLPDGRVLEKGRQLSPADVAALEAAGRREVIGAKLEAGDVHEDAAALGLARALAGPGLRSAEPSTSEGACRVGAVVLAAGSSRRMGESNKLLADVAGVPLLARVVDAVLASKAKPVVVVTGHEAPQVRAALAGREVVFTHNPDHADGLSTSLRVGIVAIGDAVDGALVCLGDMPFVTSAHLDALIAAFDPTSDGPICVPVYERKRGNPVLWPRRYFEEIGRLSGDTGARALIEAHADEVSTVPVADEGVTLDVDTPEALAALRRTLQSR